MSLRPSTRVSSDFALFRHCSQPFGCSHLCSCSNHSQDHGRLQMHISEHSLEKCACCVCCVLSVVCVLMRAGQGEERRGEERRGEVETMQQNNRKIPKMDNITGLKHDENSVGKYRNARNKVKNIKTRTPFWARYGQPRTPKRSENGQFSRRIAFLHFPWVLPTFSAEGPIPNAQEGTFLTKVLFQRS